MTRPLESSRGLAQDGQEGRAGYAVPDNAASPRSFRKSMSHTDGPPPGDQRNLCWAVAGFLLVAIAVVYGQTLSFPFLNYDDNAFVYKCPPVRDGLTGSGIAWAFTNGPFGEWFPLAMMSHMLDCQVFGLARGDTI